MSRASEMTRRRAHSFIYNHPLRDEFLAWMDEHEYVVDDLKLWVEEMAAAGDAPLEDASLIHTVQSEFEEVREAWAPLLANLLLWEFPELRPHLKRGVWKDITIPDAADENKKADSDDAESRAATGLGGEAA